MHVGIQLHTAEYFIVARYKVHDACAQKSIWTTRKGPLQEMHSYTHHTVETCPARFASCFHKSPPSSDPMQKIIQKGHFPWIEHPACTLSVHFDRQNFKLHCLAKARLCGERYTYDHLLSSAMTVQYLREFQRRKQQMSDQK